MADPMWSSRLPRVAPEVPIPLRVPPPCYTSAPFRRSGHNVRQTDNAYTRFSSRIVPYSDVRLRESRHTRNCFPRRITHHNLAPALRVADISETRLECDASRPRQRRVCWVTGTADETLLPHCPHRGRWLTLMA